MQPLPDLVPVDVRPAQFFTTLIDRLLTVTPVSYHVAVREQREHRDIPVEEADASNSQPALEPNDPLRGCSDSSSLDGRRRPPGTLGLFVAL